MGVLLFKLAENIWTNTVARKCQLIETKAFCRHKFGKCFVKSSQVQDEILVRKRGI